MGNVMCCGGEPDALAGPMPEDLGSRKKLFGQKMNQETDSDDDHHEVTNEGKQNIVVIKFLTLAIEFGFRANAYAGTQNQSGQIED